MVTGAPGTVKLDEDGITIIQVARAIGIELTPSLSWSIGARVREMYAIEFGELPEKALRQKTSGTGSHCFAVYPPEYRARIEQAIHAVNAEASGQGRLF